MRVHEGVAVLPRVGHLFEEGHAVLHLAARFEAMGDGVVRPGIAAVQGDRLACRCLGLLQAVALFQAERIHRPDIVILAIGRHDALADAQQRLGVTLVEGVELAELCCEQVARPLRHHLLVELQAAVGVARDPRLGSGKPGQLAGVGT